MARAHHQNVQSVTIKWFVSYMVVFLIPLVMFVLSSARSLNKLTDEIQYYNALTAGQVRLAFDAMVDQANLLCDEVAKTEAIDQLLAENSQPVSWDFYMASQQFSKLRKGQGVSEVLLAIPAFDMVLSDSSFAPSRLYYDSHYAESSLTYEEFHDLLFSSDNGPQFHDFSYDMPSGGAMTMMVRPLRPTLHRGKREANLIMMTGRLDEEAVAERDIVIVDTVRSSIVYANHTPTISASDLLRITREHQESVFSADVGKNHFLFATSASGVQNWTYFIYGNSKVLLSDALLMQKTSTIMLLACIVSGMVLVLFLINRNYRRVDNVMQRLSDRPFSGKGDEFQYIGDSITRIQQEKELQRDQLRKELLRSLVENDEQSTLPDRHALEDAGVSFATPVFHIVVIDADPIAYFESHGLQAYQVAPSVFIVNGPDGDETLRDIAQALQQQTGKCISMSDKAVTYRSLSLAYQEALDVHAYRSYHPTLPAVAQYSDLLSDVKDKDFSYPVEDELALGDAIRHGDGDSAIRIINRLVDGNLKAGASPLSLRFLILNLAGTVIKAISHMDEELVLTMSPSQLLRPIIRSHDFQKNEQELEKVVRSVTSVVNQHSVTVQQQEEVAWLKAIVGYIDEHYQDKNLSVTSVAEELEISPVNLSRLFKKLKNVLISDYINQVRLNHAKEILVTEENLSAVAEASGFGSLRTFMRVFKQMEGMTPGQYKAFLVEKKR